MVVSISNFAQVGVCPIVVEVCQKIIIIFPFN
jgi:hypothetical protein